MSECVQAGPDAAAVRPRSLHPGSGLLGILHGCAAAQVWLRAGRQLAVFLAARGPPDGGGAEHVAAALAEDGCPGHPRSGGQKVPVQAGVTLTVQAGMMLTVLRLPGSASADYRL